MKMLSDTQLQTFDHDYVSDAAFSFISDQIERDFSNGHFSFLDIGGGKGLFADRLLERYPSVSGTVLDNAKLLLSQNVARDRKRIVFASAAEVKDVLPLESFDIVFFNLSLHHFVGGGYRKTRQAQRDALWVARSMLKSDGRICVVENSYDGVLFHNLPGFAIFVLTSSRFLAPFVKRLGANTAGCGVCFLSTKAWHDAFKLAKLQLLAEKEEVTRNLPRSTILRNALLTLRHASRTTFWLSNGSSD